jgi:hypothetical protein
MSVDVTDFAEMLSVQFVCEYNNRCCWRAGFKEKGSLEWIKTESGKELCGEGASITEAVECIESEDEKIRLGSQIITLPDFEFDKDVDG